MNRPTKSACRSVQPETAGCFVVPPLRHPETAHAESWRIGVPALSRPRRRRPVRHPHGLQVGVLTVPPPFGGHPGGHTAGRLRIGLGRIEVAAAPYAMAI